MKDILTNAARGITGNIAKAIIFVRDIDIEKKYKVTDGKKQAEELQKELLKRTEKALSGGSYSSLTGSGGITKTSGFLALEVQFNPSSINMETVAGMEVEYEGGSLGSKSANQLVQIIHPASTTMNFELIFDEVNPSDAFMMENLAPTVGNIAANTVSGIKKITGHDYTVQDKIDGFMSLLTRDITRQVIFFWGRTCFAGELIGVSSSYTMFNKKGRPIRGIVNLSIRQGEDDNYSNNNVYWEDAFNKAFGAADMYGVTGMASTFKKITDNNFLNLNL